MKNLELILKLQERAQDLIKQMRKARGRLEFNKLDDEFFAMRQKIKTLVGKE